jgi:type I restriction-modification system DNA methylase subunit
MKRRDSEVEAYIFIRDKLGELGWDVRNPERHPDGQVYTQNQALEHDELQNCLGQDRPENIVKLSETKFWVIEAKNQREKLDQAIEEAEEYAADINESDHIESVIISGIAGNDADKYVVENQYLEDGRFRTIKMNDREASMLLSPEIVEQLLESETAELRDIPIDEDYFLQKAERINEILHQGSIHKNKRAQVMAALLLAIINSDPKMDAPPKVLIQDINNRVEAELEKEGKPDFKHQIQISLPTSEDNHVKFRDAIVRTIRELKDLNIRSAMNSSTDVLGKFYEVFLKYGNGAKDIGIVLTPRHVTEYSAEVLDIDHNDIVYDPTCGTGGFLVAALDRVRSQSNDDQVEKFKEHNLFGIEQEPEVIALALVNMIFRGDGKTNIIEANCFHRHIDSQTQSGNATGEFVDTETNHDPPATKVLMNPPFSLKNKEERSYRFIEHALEDMEDGGVLFSVVPYSILVKQAGYRRFRERLLDDHTLLSAVTLPEDVFYPVGVHTAGVFIKKGQPHPDNQNVLWVRANQDGRTKRGNDYQTHQNRIFFKKHKRPRKRFCTTLS